MVLSLLEQPTHNLELVFLVEAPLKMNLRFSCIATFTATNIYGVPTRSEKYECASKGVLEQKFLDKFNEYAPDEDIFIKLEKLAQMRDNGILTDKEFNAEKKKLLGNP